MGNDCQSCLNLLNQSQKNTVRFEDNEDNPELPRLTHLPSEKSQLISSSANIDQSQLRIVQDDDKELRKTTDISATIKPRNHRASSRSDNKNEAVGLNATIKLGGMPRRQSFQDLQHPDTVLGESQDDNIPFQLPEQSNIRGVRQSDLKEMHLTTSNIRSTGRITYSTDRINESVPIFAKKPTRNTVKRDHD